MPSTAQPALLQPPPSVSSEPPSYSAITPPLPEAAPPWPPRPSSCLSVSSSPIPPTPRFRPRVISSPSSAVTKRPYQGQSPMSGFRSSGRGYPPPRSAHTPRPSTGHTTSPRRVSSMYTRTFFVILPINSPLKRWCP